MCITGGRRCPSSRNPTKEQRDKVNARRRKLYALKKKNQEQVKMDTATYIDISDTNFSQDKITKKPELKSAEYYGFSKGELEGIMTPEKSIKRDKEKDQILSSIKSKEEQKALIDYTGSEYYDALNTEMRNHGSVEHLRSMSEKEFKQYMIDEEVEYEYEDSVEKLVTLSENLDSLMSHAQTGEERIVFRGVSIDNPEEFIKMKPGDAVTFNSFSSTSTDPVIAEMFAYGLMFEMKTNKGVWISGSEQEVVLPRTTNWRVAEIRETIVRTIIPGEKSFTTETPITLIQIIDDDLV